MSTYGDMQARVGDETGGVATTAQICNAIQDAIKSYERERFYFNETYDGYQPVLDGNGNFVTDSSGNQIFGNGFLTVLNQEFYPFEYYPAIGKMAHIDKMLVYAFSNRYPLEPRSPQWMADAAPSTTWNGLPTDWCSFGEAVRLYPIPNGVYPIIVHGTRRLDPLVYLTDTNAWMNDGEELIRSRACQIIYRRISRDAEMAREMDLEITRAHFDLKSETANRQPPAKLRVSSYF